MREEVSVRLGERSYQVHVGSGCLQLLGELSVPLGLAKKCALITDSTVGPLYAQSCINTLQKAGFQPELLIVPAGEQSKSVAVAQSLCEQMATAGLDRKSFVVALGGGVVGDLAGFVAAIYFRGIPFIQLPTTVLAQVDSSVGGKTGVNLVAGKNLIGCFHQPLVVIADTATLDTLPDREFNEGFAEVIKHAIIRDRALFEQLENFQRSSLDSIIRRNIEIKAEIVSADEHELTGERALLNFGHTIGHGIENAAGYGALLHGEAISLGLVAAARLSVKKVGMPVSDQDAIIALLEKFHLPTHLPESISTASILAALGRDKKFNQGQIRFVLSPAIGQAHLSDQVTLAEIETEIEALRA